MNLQSLATYKENLYCIVCKQMFEKKKGIKTDKGDICEDHLSDQGDWKWVSGTAQGGENQ